MPLDQRRRDVPHAHAFPLALAGEGERVRLVALAAGKNLERRLADLGLPVGIELEVVQRQGGGRMVVGREFARVALGAGMTAKMMVVLPSEDGGDCGQCAHAGVAAE